MAEKKVNSNKLIIEGDHDKLMIIMQRFQTLGVKFSYGGFDDEDIKKMTVPETQVNTKQRFDAVPANTQMAPNLADPAALPNDNLDKLKRQMDAVAGEGRDSEARKQAKEESDRQVEKLAEYERRTPNVQADASRDDADKKQRKPESDKSDKGAKNRSTKE